jgi:hypothetical protein
MTELQVTLNFACCACDEPVSVTILCQGKGSLTQSFEGVATVNVPCPSCGNVNQVYFEPNGTLRQVRLLRHCLTMLVPSVN